MLLLGCSHNYSIVTMLSCIYFQFFYWLKRPIFPGHVQYWPVCFKRGILYWFTNWYKKYWPYSPLQNRHSATFVYAQTSNNSPKFQREKKKKKRQKWKIMKIGLKKYFVGLGRDFPPWLEGFGLIWDLGCVWNGLCKNGLEHFEFWFDASLIFFSGVSLSAELFVD